MLVRVHALPRCCRRPRRQERYDAQAQRNAATTSDRDQLQGRVREVR